jgi:hypothetical protein
VTCRTDCKLRGEATQKVAKTSVFLAIDFVPMVRRGKANNSVAVESTSSTAE